jgi:4,5-DOPA dioxygenase extradiol
MEKVQHTTTQQMPVLFVGHGSPENAIQTNEFTMAWKKLGETLPKTKAILCISAHFILSTSVTAMNNPKTIHDFYGFPQELYNIIYAAPGAPEIARLVKKTIKVVQTTLDTSWGLDHGSWSVLCHMYPRANIPVLLLSIDMQAPTSVHLQIGKELAQLRKQGILIIGSGNIVHNLEEMNPNGKPFTWAISFDRDIKDAIRNRDSSKLVNYISLDSATLAQPTSDHFLPLLYVVGAAGESTPEFFNEKIVYGSVSMTSILYR